MVLINDYIPKHQVNYMAYDKYYSLLQNIYSEDCCKNTFLEIDNILNISGSPIYNLRGRSISSEIKKIDKLIKTYPENPKLFLAKAILIYKDDKLNPNPDIINLLDTVNKFGLMDYRAPYLKGLVFKQQVKYKEAITEFDKAIAIFENDPYPYRAKLKILQKIPNYDNAKIKALDEKIKFLSLPVSYNIGKLIDQIDNL